MKTEKRFTTLLLSSKQLWMLRTGQMKLPIRKIEPYKPPVAPSHKETQALPKEPVLGEIYMWDSSM